MIHKLAELEQNGTPYVLVTLIAIKGSAPQELGAKMIVTNEGLFVGTIGGGKIEAHCIDYSKQLLINESALSTQYHEWNLQTDIKMTCGGLVTVLFEKKRPSNFHLAIFGAGHVSQELCLLLSRIDCRVTVIDERDEWLQRIPSTSKIKKVKSSNLSECFEGMNEQTYFISMTKGHSSDIPVIKEIANRFPNARYVGVIGSKSKKNALFNELKNDVTPDFLERIHIPIGLPIGNNEPAEIAISIVAQLIKERDLN